MRLTADNPWKDVCEEKLPLVFAMLWRPVFDRLNWGVDYESLDPELRKLTADVLSGNRIADRLIKAFDLSSGDARYFHMEVQGKKEKDFRRRIHVCNSRSEERFATHVTSMVVLTDTNPKWRPSRYVSGCYPVEAISAEPLQGQRKKRRKYLDERTLRFLTVKLIDFEGREEALEADANPMGMFLVAHLTALRTRKDVERRAATKLRLLLNLRLRKMTPGDVRFWERCFDWFLALSEDRNRAIWEQLQQFDKEESMPFVSYAEQRGIEKGFEKGTENGFGIGLRLSLTSFLKLRYKHRSAEFLGLLDAVTDDSQLAVLCEEVFAAEDADGIRAALMKAGESKS